MDISLILQDKYLAKGWAEIQAAAEDKIAAERRSGLYATVHCYCGFLRACRQAQEPSDMTTKSVNAPL